MKKCPHCGSKNLEVEDASGHDLQIVYCLDCDAVFELTSKGSRKTGAGGRDRDFEDVEEEHWDDLGGEEEVEEDLDFDEEDR
ncbi:MAG: hypothetical protein AB1772_07750 [Candidatus Zixiibacteriota bacterium]